MFRISKNYCEILSILSHSEISGFEPKILEKELNKFIYLIYFILDSAKKHCIQQIFCNLELTINLYMNNQIVFAG